jgi:hypothetical protein
LATVTASTLLVINVESGRLSYNRKLWMLGRLKGATYPPDC